MKMQFSEITLAVALAMGLCFAQNTPEKLAVYTSGASEAGINKSISTKLLTAMSQSGIYSEIGDPGSFQDELAKSGKNDIVSIIQIAKRHGTDYVCVVNIVEVFGAYSISARLIKVASSQVVKTGLTDRSLKSLDDLTAVSNELARQILPPSAADIVPHATTVPVATVPMATTPVAVAPSRPSLPPTVNPPAISHTAPYAFLASGSFGQASPESAAPESASPIAASPVAGSPAIASSVVVDRVAAAQAAARKQCAKTYNINEVLYNLKEGFPTKLKDCSTELAKSMAVSFIPGKKKPEPKSFMQQCAVDGIRNEIPDGFPNADKIVGSVDNFVQGLLNSALAGGAVDPKKLLTAVGSMNVENLLSDIKKLASGPCMVNEPYEPTGGYSNRYNEYEDDSYLDSENGKSAVSFGIRAGINSSRSAYYSSGHSNDGLTGPFMQLGAVLDIAARNWLHFQSGLMYIQKGGLIDGNFEKKSEARTAHYLELPLLISFKAFVFRFHAGPYFGFCLSCSTKTYDSVYDIGGNYGLGLDIGMFHIGTFLEQGFVNMGTIDNFWTKNYFQNNTLGFNVGINL